jgi:hypothetical protein
MRKFVPPLLAVMFALAVGCARAEIVNIDFSTLPAETIVTNQFESQGVRFFGFGNSVFVGSVWYVNGLSFLGLTHAITDPHPGALNGIVAIFDDPIVQLGFNVHGTRIGASVTVNEYSAIGDLLGTSYFYAADFYKGAFQKVFASPVSRIEILSSEPNQTPVGIRLLEFEVAAVPEPGTLTLIALGLAGLGWSRRKQ